MTDMQNERASAPPPHARGLYPWGRLGAKYVDLYLIGFTIGVVAPGFVREFGTLGLLAAAAVLFPLVEGLAIAALGTTPGKALFRISVLTEAGDRLSALASLRRSYGAYLHGLWLGVPLVSLFAMFHAYQEYSTKRATRWDLEADARFVAQRPTWVAWVIFAVVVVVVAALQVAASD